MHHHHGPEFDAHFATRVATHPHLRLGRKPLVPRPVPLFPKMRDVMRVSGFKLPAGEPQPFDHSQGFPANSGVLNNDTRGCCTASAKGHRLQQVLLLMGFSPIDVAVLAPLVLQFYSETTGFDASQDQPDPNNPGQVINPTDQGGDMDAIGLFLTKTGFPLPPGLSFLGGALRDVFVGAFTIDPHDVAGLAFCGNECLGIDFGINVTDSVMPSDGSPPPAVWDVLPGEKDLGGHDIYSLKLRPNGNWGFDSWGNEYEFTPAFGAKNVVQALCYVSADAVKDGKTLLGLDLAGWVNTMAGHAQAVAAGS